MARKIDITFNSEKDNNKGYFQIASGYISETNILFEKENIVAVVQATGQVEFLNSEDLVLASGQVSPVDEGKGVYEEICCKVEDNLITLEFPIYEWIDNYPNCDGEHDRWDTRKVGSHTLKFDFLTNSIL